MRTSHGGREDRGDGADGERRPELHRRQALHRRPRDPRAVRGGAGRGDARLSRWAIRPAKPPSSARWSASRRATKSTTRSSESIAKGARLLLGGEVPDRPGAWYPATVLTDVRPGQPAHDEEVFGPVAAIIAADDEADAIRIANASEFGLGSGVLTSDLDRGRRIAAEELEAGHELRQRECPLRFAHPVRRGQAFRLRPRMRAPSASTSSSTSRPCT